MSDSHLEQAEKKRTNTRDSGIELLKIIAIFLIVISHTIQSLASKSAYLSYSGYVIDLSVATSDLQTILLTIMRHFGSWGNNIFFVCSAWFLLKSTTYSKRKVFSILADVWVVSIVLMVISLILLKGNVSRVMLLKSIFPTTFSNNWYITCYLLFYPTHPILNRIIQSMSQKALFRTTAALAVLYIFLNFIDTWFFSSYLILWLAIYFVVAYMQKYLMKYADNLKWNVWFFAANAFCLIALILVTEFAGLHISFLSTAALHWAKNCNPFLIFMSIAMLNIARNIHFKSRPINFISSLSLLVYITHENIFLGTYFRPAMWNYIYTHYGYDFVVGWVFVMAIVLFLFGLLASILYTSTLQKVVSRAIDRLYSALRKRYLSIERKLITPL